jgi:RND superfamily putative drug exporter
MSAGILIDTFLVRTLLVPALVGLVGEANWWPRRRRLRAARSEA